MSLYTYFVYVSIKKYICKHVNCPCSKGYLSQVVDSISLKKLNIPNFPFAKPIFILSTIGKRTRPVIRYNIFFFWITCILAKPIEFLHSTVLTLPILKILQEYFKIKCLLMGWFLHFFNFEFTPIRDLALIHQQIDKNIN